eukprot:gene2707-8117_t
MASRLETHNNHSDPNPDDVLTPNEAAGDVDPLHYAAGMGNRMELLSVLRNMTREQVNTVDVYGRTALIYAITSNKSTCAELLILHGIDINHPVLNEDYEGRTALHWACIHSKSKMVKILLEHSADPFLKDHEGRTPLHYTCSIGNYKTYQQLIKCMKEDIQINDFDDFGMTCLHWAAHAGSLDIVKHIITKMGGMFLVRDKEGKSPVHWAAGTSSTFADVDIVSMVDLEGRSPLHVAVAAGKEKVVIYLNSLDRLSATIQDAFGRTPLHWAAYMGHSRIITQLMKQRGALQFQILDSNGASALQYCAYQGHVDAVRALLVFSDVSDIPDMNGRTALIVGAMLGSEDIVDMLAKSEKSNVYAKDNMGRNAVHYAAYFGHTRILNTLLEAGCPVHETDYSERTAIFYAAEAGQAECMHVLIEHGADLSFRDEEGRTLLHWACISGNMDAVQILLTCPEVEVDARDTSLRTPLHFVVFVDHVDIILLLIQAGADVNAQDSMGIAPLHWAASRELFQMTQILLGYGAVTNVSEYHEERLTPLDYALVTGNEDIVKLLRSYGAVTAEQLKDHAAKLLQAWWKGHQSRISLLSLFKKHIGFPLPERDLSSSHDFEGERPFVKVQDGGLTSLKRLSASHVVPQHSGILLPSYTSSLNISSTSMPDLTSQVSLPNIKANIKSNSSIWEDRKRKKKQATSQSTALPSISNTPGLGVSSLATSIRTTISPQHKKTSPTRKKRIQHPTALVPNFPIRNDTQAQVLQERMRVKDIRSKIHAATLIQRAFRRWRLNPNREFLFSSNHRSKTMGYEGTIRAQIDVNNKKQQIAALTIQLAWRRYIGRKTSRSTIQQSRNTSSARQRRRQLQQKAVYGSSVPLFQWKPCLSRTARPIELLSLPSPAATSFSMALGTYAKPIIDVQRYRLKRAEALLRAKSQEAERRLLSTEYKMHLVLALAGHRPGSAILDTIEENDLDSQDDVFEKEPRVQISSQPEQKTQRIDPYEILRQYQAKHGITT